MMMRLRLSGEAFRAFRMLFESFVVVGSPFALLGVAVGAITLDAALVLLSVVGLAMFAFAMASFIWLFGMAFDLLFVVIRFVAAEIFGAARKALQKLY
jgi:hypothetical protein